MNEISDTKRIIELLEESLKWKRFEGAQLAKKILRDLLSKDTDKIVYQYSDGRGTKEIAALAGVSDFTVRNCWKRWNVEGLVIPSNKFAGRYERVFSLEDFGIDVPKIKSLLPESETENPQSEERVRETQ